jgi:hypothetical protein
MPQIFEEICHQPGNFNCVAHFMSLIEQRGISTCRKILKYVYKYITFINSISNMNSEFRDKIKSKLEIVKHTSNSFSSFTSIFDMYPQMSSNKEHKLHTLDLNTSVMKSMLHKHASSFQ